MILFLFLCLLPMGNALTATSIPEPGSHTDPNESADLLLSLSPPNDTDSTGQPARNLRRNIQSHDNKKLMELNHPDEAVQTEWDKKAGKRGAPKTTSTTKAPSESWEYIKMWGFNEWVWFSFGLFVLSAVIVAGACCCWKRKKTKAKKDEAQEGSVKVSNIQTFKESVMRTLNLRSREAPKDDIEERLQQHEERRKAQEELFLSGESERV